MTRVLEKSPDMKKKTQSRVKCHGMTRYVHFSYPIAQTAKALGVLDILSFKERSNILGNLLCLKKKEFKEKRYRVSNIAVPA